MTRWRVEVLSDAGAVELAEEFKTYAKASDYARTWPFHDVRLVKLVEVAFFKHKEHDASSG